MINEEPKFKECPFCGHLLESVTMGMSNKYSMLLYVGDFWCPICNTETKVYGTSIDDVITRWNTRTEDKKEDSKVRVEPKTGEVWKHFKGTLYSILDIAVHTETGEKMVVYCEYGKPMDKVWTRPMDMFMSEVDTKKYPNSQYTYRFTRII
jgi:hypothetical protein